MSKWPLNGKGNAALVGAVVVALGVLLTLFNAVPWASKAEVTVLKVDTRADMAAMEARLQRELSEIKAEVGALRDFLMGPRPQKAVP